MTVKRTKVIMFPTNEKASRMISENGILKYHPSGIDVGIKDYQHLYFLSDDEIKEGDWCVKLYPSTIFQVKSVERNRLIYPEGSKKIIATTNISLKVKDPNHPDILPDWNLPQPSQSFIEKYVEEYNKGNVITDVLVEYETPYVKGNYSNTCTICKEVFYNTDKLGFVCPKHQYLKVNPKDNTITIKKIKDSWTREEVKHLLEKCWFDAIVNGKNLDANKWIEENL